MSCTNHCGNKRHVVLNAEIVVLGITEAHDHELFGRNDVDALAKESAGEKAVFRKTVCHAPGGRFARAVIGPKARAVSRTKRGAPRPLHPSLRKNALSIWRDAIVKIKLA